MDGAYLELEKHARMEAVATDQAICRDEHTLAFDALHQAMTDTRATLVQLLGKDIRPPDLVVGRGRIRIERWARAGGSIAYLSLPAPYNMYRSEHKVLQGTGLRLYRAKRCATMLGHILIPQHDISLQAFSLQSDKPTLDDGFFRQARNSLELGLTDVNQPYRSGRIWFGPKGEDVSCHAQIITEELPDEEMALAHANQHGALVEHIRIMRDTENTLWMVRNGKRIRPKEVQTEW